MKTALLITTYNRPEYLRQCLWSLERADLSRVDKVIIVDDASTNPETHKLLSNFITRIGKTRSWVNEKNSGIKHSLLTGYDDAFSNGFDIVINLDSDAIVRPDFVQYLTQNYKRGKILTGFNCKTKNANGTERHLIVEENDYFIYKKSVGGINFCIDKEAYESFVKPALNMPHNWDNQACILHESKHGYGAVCLKQSVIQHIGFDSSMGHHEAPDIADDFYYWDLPSVTLIGVDNVPSRLQPTIDKCMEFIRFATVKMLHPDIRSKEAYSEYCLTELYKHVHTTHMLICQHDGFVNNWMAWDNDWLQYDYIGAPWWYNDGYDVGNGGFSLRSRRLMEIVATDTVIKLKHPEDDVICRTYRLYLERVHGIKFAPLEVAERFSFEGYRQPKKVLSDQFGVHGPNPRREVATVRKEKLIFNQFLSLGDILFLIPMYRALVDEGNEVLWPIDAIYLPIAKHFPDIRFVDKSDYDLPYDFRGVAQTPFGKLLPYRWASELMSRDLRYCMNSKFELFGHDYNMWRELFWQRDKVAETKLIKLVGAKGRFNLVNRTFGHKAELTITPNIQNEYPIIEMCNIDGYTLIDWLGVVELATEIHASNSSLNYLIELMNLDIPVYLYKRNIWGEVGFNFTRHLWKNKCFRFIE